MEHTSQRPTLIIGVGNSYRTDDGVGPLVVRRLAAMNLPGVVVREESGEGAALMESWKDADHVIVIDAVSSGSPPGTIHRIDAHTQSVPASFFHYSSHAFGVAEAIEMARALDRLPAHLVLFGTEGKDFGAGFGLSAEVDGAAEEVLKMVAQEITHSISV